MYDQYFSALRGKRVGVVGLGVSNRPLVETLAAYGAVVTAYDKDSSIDPAPWNALGVTLVLGEDYLDRLGGEVVFRTPGLRPDHPALERVRASGGTVTSEMDVFFTLCPATLIAVTGSDGKTTTTTLIAELLKAEFEGLDAESPNADAPGVEDQSASTQNRRVFLGGNIGTPLLTRIPDMTARDFAVVELSSFQLMDMTHSPRVAVITNITPNHLDWHRGMDEYIAAKQRLLDFQGPKDLAILNAENAVTAAMPVKGRRVLFGWNELQGGKIGGFLSPEDIFLPGRHNAENMMAAVAATAEWVRPETVTRVAAGFKGVAHRNQFLRETRGVAFYNDSIGSSPTRTLATLSAHKRPVVLICGGYDKNLGYEPLARELPHLTKAVVLMGATAPKIRAAAEGVPGCPPLHSAESLEDAVRQAFTLAESGDVVLLSPASASFDMFKNFEERGKAFERIVAELSR